MAKPNKAADLLKVLGQKIPSRAAESAPPQAPAPSAPRDAAKLKRAARPREPKAKAVRGKAIQFYLHEADERLIREFAVWLAPHRKRINDSLVVKAVLRAAKTGPALLAAYDEAIKSDGRSKTRPKAE